jgi:2-polyprenyl-3-methyl-5-hydroxy-6-metoxy-1,4-benzoquinol methylase
MGLLTVGCLSCGLVLTNPQPTDESLERFYATEYRKLYQRVESPSPGYIRRYGKDRRAAQLAEKLRGRGLLRPGARVLDFGAAEGSVLRAMVAIEGGLQAVAVEPQAEFAAFAASHIPCDVFPDLKVLEATSPAPFDLIVLNHVLEHVKRPKSLLWQLRGLLAPNGMLYVDVPSLEDYSDIGMLHIAHLAHYTEETLRRALNSCSFEVVHTERHQPIQHPPSLMALARRAEKAIEGSPSGKEAGWDRIRRIVALERLYFLRRVGFIHEVVGCASWMLRAARRCWRRVTGPDAL